MEMFIYAMVMLVASVLINAALAPKPQDAKPATYDDFNLPSAEEGTPQAVFFGECWSGDWQVLSYGNLRTSPVYSEEGKK